MYRARSMQAIIIFVIAALIAALVPIRAGAAAGGQAGEQAGVDAAVGVSGNFYMGMKWSQPIEGQPITHPVVGPDGTIFVLADSGYFYAFSADGVQKWSANLQLAKGIEGRIVEGLIRPARDGKVIVALEGDIYAFDANGSKLWEYTTPRSYLIDLEIQQNGKIYVLSNGLQILNGDGTNSAERYGVNYVVKHAGVDGDQIFLFSSNLKIASDNKERPFQSVYAVEQLSTSGISMSKTDLGDREVYTKPWTSEKGDLWIPARPASSPFLTELGHYLQQSELLLVRNGSIQATLKLPAHMRAAPLADEQGNLYVLTLDSTISKFSPAGEKLWSYKVLEGSNSYEQAERLFLDKDGNIILYSQASKISGGYTQSLAQNELKRFKLSPAGKLLSSAPANLGYGIVPAGQGTVMSLMLDFLYVTDLNSGLRAAYQTGANAWAAVGGEQAPYVIATEGKLVVLERKAMSGRTTPIKLAFDISRGLELPIGAIYPLQAVASIMNGEEWSNPFGVTYRTDNSNIAYFEGNVLHTLRPGTVGVVAEYEGLTAHALIKITDATTSETPDQQPLVTYRATLSKQHEAVLPPLNREQGDVYVHLAAGEDNHVLATSTKGKLVYLNSEGEIQWEAEVGKNITTWPAGPATGPDGRLYIPTHDGQLLAYNAQNGQSTIIKTVANSRSSLVGWDNDRNLYAGFGSSQGRLEGKLTVFPTQLFAFDSQGNHKWFTSLNGTIADPRLSFNLSEDTLYIVATTDERPTNIGTAGSGGIAVNYTKHGTLYALNAANGGIRWTAKLAPTKNEYLQPMVLEDGTVIVATGEGFVEIIEDGGKSVETFNLKQHLAVHAEPGNNKLFSNQPITALQQYAPGLETIAFMNVGKIAYDNQGNLLLNNTTNIVSLGADGEQRWSVSLAPSIMNGVLLNSELDVVALDITVGKLIWSKIKVTETTRPKPNGPDGTANPAEPPRFTDVSGHWAEEAIKQLAASGILTGFADGTFRPNDQVTREQFLSILAKKLGFQAVAAGGSPFADIEEKRWSAGLVALAVEQGWVLPADYGKQFSPGAAVTREEVAAWLARAMAFGPVPGVSQQFTDEDHIKAGYRGLVGAVVEAGLMMGYNDSSFKPNRSLTRAEAAMLLSRVE